MENETVLSEKISLSDISLSIHSKRRVDLDNQNYPFDNIQLADYDIRQSRDVEKMKDDLFRDGQLQPITVNFDNDTDFADGMATIINGRTRYYGMKALNEENEDMFAFVNIEVYVGLTELEQNYLNAQINVSQNPLTATEKLAFVEKYQNQLDAVELGKALGLSLSQVQKYVATSKIDPEVREKFVQKTEGYGRGEINVETAGDCVISYESESGGKMPDKETLGYLGEKFNEMDLTRDIKRKLVKKISKNTAKLQNDERITKTYNKKEIVEIAEKEAIHNSYTGGSGDYLPKNSSKKYKIIDELLKKDEYEFGVILFAESLYRIDENGNEIPSETKRIIDKIDKVSVVGNEIMKLVDMKEYGENNNKKVVTYYGDVFTMCKKMKENKGKGFIFVNGASLYSQRPEFMNYLKKKYPNSTIAMVVLDLLFGKSQIVQENRDKEILTVYEGAKNFDEVLEQFKKRVKFTKIRKYATRPQKKYIIFV